MEQVAAGKCITDYQTWSAGRSDGTTLDECFENCKRKSCKYFSYDSRGRKCYYTTTGSISGTCSKEVVYQRKAQNQPGTRQYEESCDRNEDCAHGRLCNFVGVHGLRMCLGRAKWSDTEEEAAVGMYIGTSNHGKGCLKEPWYSQGNIGYRACRNKAYSLKHKTFSLKGDKCYTSPVRGWESGIGCGIFNSNVPDQEDIYTIDDAETSVGAEAAVGMYIGTSNHGKGCLKEPWYSQGSIGYRACRNKAYSLKHKTFSLKGDKCYTSPVRGWES